MELIKASREALLKPLAVVSGIVERRHTMPILANLLIRKEGSKVSMMSSDLEVQITTHAEFGVGGESESTTVSARKFLDILRALPDSKDISIEQKDKKLTIQSGKSRFSLQTLPAQDFPVNAAPESWLTRLTMTQKALKNLLSMVHFSMAQQDIRYYLNGMLFVVDSHYVRAVATDGHRLAYCATQVDGDFGHQEVIIPRKTVLELLRLLDDSDTPVTVSVAANQIRFEFADIDFISKLVEGKFPDYQRVIPQGYTKSFEISREELQRCLQRAAILTTDKLKGVRVQLGNNLLKISASNSEQEEAQEELEVAFAYDNLDIGFNVNYLLDILGNLKCESISVSVGDANSSALIQIPADNDFKYVVMPMRI